MENVNLNAFNTDEEKLKVVNLIIDNQRCLEGEVLRLVEKSRSVEAHNKEIDKYNKGLL